MGQSFEVAPDDRRFLRLRSRQPAGPVRPSIQPAGPHQRREDGALAGKDSIRRSTGFQSKGDLGRNQFGIGLESLLDQELDRLFLSTCGNGVVDLIRIPVEQIDFFVAAHNRGHVHQLTGSLRQQLAVHVIQRS